MPAEQPRHLSLEVIDGILVAKINESHLQGDTLAEALRQELLDAVASHASNKVVLDMQQVQYLSSAAFRPLLSLRRKLQETNGSMCLCNVSPAVLEVFQLVRLVSTTGSHPATFDCRPDVTAAITFLKDSPQGK